MRHLVTRQVAHFMVQQVSDLAAHAGEEIRVLAANQGRWPALRVEQVLRDLRFSALAQQRPLLRVDHGQALVGREQVGATSASQRLPWKPKVDAISSSTSSTYTPWLSTQPADAIKSASELMMQ